MEIEIEGQKFGVKRFGFKEKSVIEGKCTTLVKMPDGTIEPELQYENLKMEIVRNGLTSVPEGFTVKIDGKEVPFEVGNLTHVENLDYAIGDAIFKAISSFNSPNKKKLNEN